LDLFNAGDAITGGKRSAIGAGFLVTHPNNKTKINK
jgi:hypothetical protein